MADTALEVRLVMGIPGKEIMAERADRVPTMPLAAVADIAPLAVLRAVTWPGTAAVVIISARLASTIAAEGAAGLSALAHPGPPDMAAPGMAAQQAFPGPTAAGGTMAAAAVVGVVQPTAGLGRTDSST